MGFTLLPQTGKPGQETLEALAVRGILGRRGGHRRRNGLCFPDEAQRDSQRQPLSWRRGAGILPVTALFPDVDP